MTELSPISNNSPVSLPAAPVAQDTAKSASPAATPKPAEVASQSVQASAFEVERYTARYSIEGRRLNIQILDADGRLVRTVPPSELLRALQAEFEHPRLNLQG